MVFHRFSRSHIPPGASLEPAPPRDLLLDRAPGKLHRRGRLTPKGKELVFYVERLLELTNEMQQRITPSDSVTGLVRVGVVEIIAYTWLPQFIRALRVTYPNVALELEIALTAELVEKLVDGSL